MFEKNFFLFDIIYYICGMIKKYIIYFKKQKT
jgi:hypothetical protein